MKPVMEIRNTLSLSGVNHLLIGISGGADSVALLRGSIETGAQISAVHCDFHLRGEESERDRRFVIDLCRGLNIPLSVIDFDVESYIRQHRVSVEMACRELRYREFRRLKESTGADRIAVAHNADDNAETLLLNLMRGAGVAGLRAMKRDTGEIIRPLLYTSRAEILDYLSSIGQTYVTDSSNLESDYRRNFLRNEVMPLLSSRWPEARQSINRTSRIMSGEEKILDWAERQFADTEASVLPYRSVRECPDGLWLIRRFAARFGGSSRMAEEMYRALQDMAFQSGKRWIVPDGRIVAERNGFEFVAQTSGRDDESICISSEVFPVSDEILQRVKNSPMNELWTDLPPEKITFRRARQGDRIKPLGMRGSMLVSKAMKDAKLSTAQKENCLVAENNETGDIIWIENLKRSRQSLVSEASVRCYRYSSTEGRG